MRAEEEAEDAAAVRGRDREERDPDPDEDQREHADNCLVERHARLVDRRHHHPAGCVLQHVVDGAPEDRPLTPADVPSRGADDDDLGPAALGLANDLGACVPAAHEPRDHRDAVAVADGAGLVELAVRAHLLLRQLCAQRQFERDLEHRHRRDLGAALGREARGDVERVVRGAAGQHGHEQASVLERQSRAVRRRRLDRRQQGLVDDTAAVHGVEQQPADDPAEAHPACGRVLDEDDDEGGAGRDPAEDREQRPVGRPDSEDSVLPDTAAPPGLGAFASG